MIRFVGRRLLWTDPHAVPHHVPGLRRDPRRHRSGAELPAAQPAGQRGEGPAVPRGQRPQRQHRLAVLQLAAALRHVRLGSIDQGQPPGVAGAQGSAWPTRWCSACSPRSSASSSASASASCRRCAPARCSTRPRRPVPSSASRSRRTSAPSCCSCFFAITLTRWLGLDKPLLPTSGVYPAGHKGFDLVLRLKHLILPVTVVAIQIIAVYSRYMRASLLEVKNSDYLRTARAKGVSERRILVRHALRNALIPIVTVAADRHRRRSSAGSSSPSASSRTRGWATSS